jgi:hypothetical protein
MDFYNTLHYLVGSVGPPPYHVCYIFPPHQRRVNEDVTIIVN